MLKDSARTSFTPLPALAPRPRSARLIPLLYTKARWIGCGFDGAEPACSPSRGSSQLITAGRVCCDNASQAVHTSIPPAPTPQFPIIDLFDVTGIEPNDPPNTVRKAAASD